MNVSLRQLRIFLAVAELRHFHRAAERLHLTQPAVSRQVAELERALGVRLFDRHTRGVLPTEAGQYLQHALSRVLDDLEAVLAHAHAEGERQRGTVRVAAVPTLSAGLMPACIAACAARYPELDIRLHDQVQTLVLDQVRGGEVDFGLVVEPADTGDFDSETIMYDDFVLVCPPSHPLAGYRRIPWLKLHDARLVLLDHASGSRRLIDEALQRQGIHVRVVQQTGHAHTAFRMVEAGLGMTITPALSLPAPGELVVRPLQPTVRRAIVLIRRRHRSLSPPAQRVWDQLRLTAAEHAAQTATGMDHARERITGA